MLSEEAFRHLGRGSGDQNVFGALEKLFGDGDDVVGALAESENDFWHAVAQCAVMIDLGETEIFEGQVTHAGESGIGVDRAAANIIEKFPELVFCHWTGVPLTA